MSTTLDMFSNTVQKTHEWVLDLKEELVLEDEHRLFRLLKAVLHALRDRTSAAEAAQLGAQLPALLRGYYYEGFSPAGKQNNVRTKEEFLDAVSREVGFDAAMDPEEAVRAVFRVVWRRVSTGEIEDVVRTLPADIRRLWPVL